MKKFYEKSETYNHPIDYHHHAIISKIGPSNEYSTFNCNKYILFINQFHYIIK